jgi:hypothetical protein
MRPMLDLDVDLLEIMGMGEVIVFARREPVAPQEALPREAAILFFTGVRYVRDLPQTKPPARRSRRRSSQRAPREQSSSSS